MSMKISALPVEIIVEITLKIKDIFVLENWLCIVKYITRNQAVTRHRWRLTQQQNSPFKYEKLIPILFFERNRLYGITRHTHSFIYWLRRLNSLLNYKFYGKDKIKRGEITLYKSNCFLNWINIDSLAQFEIFLRKYETVWW